MITSTLTRIGLLETVELKLTIPKDGLLYAAKKQFFMLDQGESLTNFRVSGVELRFPAPPHFGHSFLESPSPIVPLP